MTTDQSSEMQVARLRAELERERREHQQTLLLLDAVTEARNRAEAAVATRHRRSRLDDGTRSLQRGRQ